MKLEFNLNNNVEMPEIILGKRNYEKLGSIVNFDNLTYEYNLMSADSVSFTVYKELNSEKERLWDEIKDRRLIYLKEFDEWFQIDVSTSDSNGVTKEITGTSLCEAELSQVYIRSTEINTENDIARPEYINPTIFYKPSNPDESLLHRLLKVAPNYTIKHVDNTLCNIQRMFSIDGVTLYDTLTGEIAEEIGCLFLFDSKDRSISVYDLKTNCNHCGYRGDYTDSCPECNSTDLNYGYGNDTTIFVDSETLADSISLSGKQDEVKNYIKVCGGDELMDTAITACNPTGTQYIYTWSDRDKEDMTEELCSKLEEYSAEYKRLTPDYQDIMANIYDIIDLKLQLESTMMPDIETAETNAKQELAKLTAANLNPVAVQDVSVASVYTVNKAVLGMAKCIVNSTVYKIEFVDGSTSFTNQTWKGKFRITNYSDEDDTAENTGYITLTINDDYAYYIEQKIRKTIDRDDIYLVDIFDVKTDLNVFKTELKNYCLNRLNSFESAYQSVIDIMIDANCASNAIYGDIYNDLYLPYYNKLIAIQAEIKVRTAEIKAEDEKLPELEKAQSEITEYLNLENFLGDTLWKELCSFRREDSFENSNYISDGLDNSELLQKAQELLEKAQIDTVTASTLQMSLSTTMFNLLAIPEFQKLTGMFEGGNWIRAKLDEKICRLRLIHYKIDFSQIQNINVEFSDVTETSNGLNDSKNLMEKVSSMAANFNYVAHKAEQGSKSFTELDTIRNTGLNTALYNISTSVNQDFIIDEHGITGRQWDDIIEDYQPEQVKFINNCLVYTDDYWQTAKAALGKIEYYNPVSKKTVSQYGLIADAVISGIIIGNDIVGGDIYSENYSSTVGTHIDLNNGNFSFAGGKLTYDSTDNTLNVTGEINATSGYIGGWTINGRALYADYDIYRAYIQAPASATDWVFSVQNKSGGSYIGEFTVQANGKLTAKNADVSGTIKATEGSIGKWTIGTPKKSYGLNECLYTETNFGIIGLQSSSNSNNVAFFVKDSSGNDITYIKNDGTLYTQKAEIEGTINATSGKIAGYKINDNQLTSSVTSDNSMAYISMKSDYTNNGYIYNKDVLLTHNGTKCNVTKTFDASSGLITLDAYNKYTTNINYGINGISASLSAFDSNYGQPTYSGSSNITFGFNDFLDSGLVFAITTIKSDYIDIIGSPKISGGSGVSIHGGLTIYSANLARSADLYVIGSTEITNNLFIGNYISSNSYIKCKDYISSDSYISSGGYMNCKGTMEILTDNNSSNVILHNNYDRKIYLRYDEQSRFYIVPHTSDGFDTQNCFYMDAYTGDCCARSFVSASSMRYKENIKSLSDDFIDNFSKIRPVSFDYKPNIGYKNQYGLIAEEMEEIYPYVVTHDRDGNCEAIDYSKLTILLIKKVQAMDKEIQHLYQTISQYGIIK